MTCYKYIVLLFLSLGFILNTAIAQDSIFFSNPSFEDMPRHSHAPKEWTNCGFINESPPDVQPEFTFLVSQKAFDGNTYLGMVVRDNNTWESVGNSLSTPLQKDSCYQFQISLSRSSSYMSQSRELNMPANYITPTIFKLWGSNTPCEAKELLAESPPIQHENWREYTFTIRPNSDNTKFIILEVFFDSSTTLPYNGNLLLDKASAFIPVSGCSNAELTSIKTIGSGITNIAPIPLAESMQQPQVRRYSRMLDESEIDQEVVCILLDELLNNNQDVTLINFAHYISQFNTKRWRWSIVVDIDNENPKIQKQSIRKWNQRIHSLQLERQLKVIEMKKLRSGAVFLCSKPYGGGTIGIYY